VFLSKKYSDFFHRLVRLFPSGAKRSRGIPWSNLCVMPRDPSIPLGTTKKNAARTLIDIAASSPVHFARSAMKPF